MQVSSMTVNELKALFQDIIKTEMILFSKKFLKNIDSDIITRKETAILLRIDLSTLWEWTVEGKIQKHKIGRRVYYKKSEIEALLNKN